MIFIQEILEEAKIKTTIDKDLEGLAEILKNGDRHFFNCLKYLFVIFHFTSISFNL